MEEKILKLFGMNVVLHALKDLSTRLNAEVSCALTLTGSGFKIAGSVEIGNKDVVHAPKSDHPWLFHTHLGDNMPPSKNDLSVALTYGYNKLKEAVHIIYDNSYIWWLCVKDYIEKIEPHTSDIATNAIKAILVTYEKLINKYKTQGDFNKFRESLLTHGISINRTDCPITLDKLYPQ